MDTGQFNYFQGSQEDRKQSLPVTFRLLAEQEGFLLADPLPQEWPLEKWFASVCDLPLNRFTVFDLARSCRQNICVEAVLPFCLRALQFIPLAGELFDGELLTSVIGRPADYWSAHAQQRDAVVMACHAALLETDDEDLKAEVERWLALQQTEDIVLQQEAQVR